MIGLECRSSALTLLLGALLFAVYPASAQDTGPEALPTIAEKTEGMERIDGYVPVYWDDTTGKLWLEISRFDTEFLYLSALPTGLGSNPVGLDRGQLGDRHVVRFERTGPEVLLVAPNLDYRASSDNPQERAAVREAFAQGVLWGFEVAAEGPGGQVLVDATDFVVRDAHGVARRLQNSDQGTYALDDRRSAPVLEHVKAFPKNTELEARLTFTTDGEPGEYVEQTAATPRAVTLRVRHSFVALPDTSGYSPRRFDPRAGLFYERYMDFATPVGTSMSRRVVNRHRLHCAAPPGEDGLCPAEEPIVYYLDPGTPEPVRSALLDGARWWAEAFRAAGYEDAFRVEVLPDSADPMDVRYNVIQWVHRRTRGWSYGASVTDPRTGEILKGHVTLGSQRVRQDYLLAEGLLAPYKGDHADGFSSGEDPMLKMALARIRQLAAHEVGHTLGLAHNFAASTNGRASVMDYPAPLARVQGDSITLDRAYDTGVERWDKVALRYAYAAPAPDQTEDELLGDVLRAAERNELRYITDADARPAGAAHPKANLWDNGGDMVQALEREMNVREVALDRFGTAVVKSGEPLALMEEVLVPLYLRHRYQVTATAKLLGGESYEYAVRGEGSAARSEPVPADRQAAALDALLATITPEALALPEAARERIPPRPPGHPDTRELFDGRTGPTFDPYVPAEVAATMVFDALTQPHRALRLIEQNDADDRQLSFQETLRRVTNAVWKSKVPSDSYRAEVQRAVQQTWTDVLLDRAGSAEGAPAVHARIEHHLRSLRDWLAAHPGDGAEGKAHREAVEASISRFLNRSRDTAVSPAAADAPPGSPIGHASDVHRRHTQRQTWLDRWRPLAPVCTQQRP